MYVTACPIIKFCFKPNSRSLCTRKGAFLWLNAKAFERVARSPRWRTCTVLHPGDLFHETMVLLTTCVPLNAVCSLHVFKEKLHVWQPNS